MGARDDEHQHGWPTRDPETECFQCDLTWGEHIAPRPGWSDFGPDGMGMRHKHDSYGADGKCGSCQILSIEMSYEDQCAFYDAMVARGREMLEASRGADD